MRRVRKGKAHAIRPFRKVLVANRGEIAIRVFRACTELGIRTVAVYSNEDRLSLHRYKADEAYLIGAGVGPVAAYLAAAEIIALARAHAVDAIHPGYGFLSESAGFARACEKAGVAFIGPPSEVMRSLGDKLAARLEARKLGIPVLPGTDGPVGSIAGARSFAAEVGYPVIVKASLGGGGRGMRVVRSENELEVALPLARKEAQAAFGSSEVFLEKFLESPKHIEVQILGDRAGQVVHLFERDCSIQRRHQKVIEVAPAVSLSPAHREELCRMAVRLGRAAGYRGAGTCEFLMDGDGRFYFIECNTRIQVEHTITEMVTGVDLVQAQIRLAEGYSIGSPESGVPAQEEISVRGHAIQCRITTENPEQDFLPDYGKLTAYRSAAGFGIRLDAGSAYPGAVITPYYDSLLVKVTSWGLSFDAAVRRMQRALAEFRVRGVVTNIPFLANVLSHPTFQAGACDTTFIASHPELVSVAGRRDRASRLMRFLAEVTVNGNPVFGRRTAAPAAETPRPLRIASAAPFPRGTRQILRKLGPERFASWARREKRLLVTDTTFRDAHQSLLSTRGRSYDFLAVADEYARNLPGLFSLEMWGGATFDTAMRFLREDPWDRLTALRARIPNICFQMLLRGANTVGYASYPDNVVRAFVHEAAQAGIDIFRIFDSLNWAPAMAVAMEAVRREGKVAEAALCYTGDLLDPARDKYTLSYYVKLARELVRMGAHIVAIKDMAGLLKPHAAAKLVTALREATGLPVHLHTHDTPSIQSGAVLRGADAGLDIADLAIASLSGLTSQPNLNSIVAALRHLPRDTGLDLPALNRVSRYFETARRFYAPFESELRSGSAEVYEHEMPGGQYSNLKSQADSLGLSTRWEEVLRAYREVNLLLGDIVKVTPSSKVVGDMALFMVSNRLTSDDVLARGESLSFPESVVGFFEGRIGQPPFGFPKELSRIVLRGRKALEERPGAVLPAVDWESLADEAEGKVGRRVSQTDLLSYVLYPEVFVEFDAQRRAYGDLSVLPTKSFWFGMEVEEEIAVEIEEGKTLQVKLLSIGEPRPDGTRVVFFELNGAPREAVVADRTLAPAAEKRRRAEPGNPHHLGAPMPGLVAEVKVKPGDSPEKGDPLLVLEAMKMQLNVAAPISAAVQEVLVAPRDTVQAGDLLVVFQ